MKTFKDIFDLFGISSKNDKKQLDTPLNDTEKALADLSIDNETDDLASYIQNLRLSKIRGAPWAAERVTFLSSGTSPRRGRLTSSITSSMV